MDNSQFVTIKGDKMHFNEGLAEQNASVDHPALFANKNGWSSRGLQPFFS